MSRSDLAANVLI